MASNKISELEGELQNHKTQGEKLKKFLKGLQQENERLTSLVSEKESEISEKDVKIKELSENGFKNESEMTAIIEKAKRSDEDKALAEKEKQQTIAKLKLVTSQLSEMKQKCQESDISLQSEKVKTFNLNEAISKMQNEMHELESALNSADSEIRQNAIELDELRKKSQKHNSEMIEKNRQLKDAQDKLKDIEQQRNEIVLSFTMNDCQFYEIPEKVDALNEIEIKDKKNADMSNSVNNNNSLVNEPFREDGIEYNNHSHYDDNYSNNNISLSYIQKLMIQFFNQDNDQRELLVPVILKILGCDQLQIQQAQNSWKNSFKKRGFGWF